MGARRKNRCHRTVPHLCLGATKYAQRAPSFLDATLRFLIVKMNPVEFHVEQILQLYTLLCIYYLAVVSMSFSNKIAILCV